MNFISRFDSLHEQATAATGLVDFGPDDYHDPLRRILADYDRYPRFSAAGIATTMAELIGKLVGRLVAQQGFKQYPHFLTTPIEKPIIIVGMPRTGTTALQRLLCQDPGTQALELWLAAMPMPRPPRASWPDHPVYRQVAEQIRALNAASPALAHIHPVFADQPDECRFSLDQSFWSPGLATTATVPDYGQWCLDTDARYSYRYHRQVMGLIAAGDTRRWVLKNPDHIFALDALLDVFPDACIVQTHRDPAYSMASLCSLSYEILQMREPEITPAAHARNAEVWIRALDKAAVVRRRLDPARFFDLHIDEINADQVGAVERIYHHFGLPVSAAARAAWRQRASADPRAGHGSHDYRFERFGVDAQRVRAEAPAYCDLYSRLWNKELPQ